MSKFEQIKQGQKVGNYTVLGEPTSGRRKVQCICGNIRYKTDTELRQVQSGKLDPMCNICIKVIRREDPVFFYREVLAQYKRHAREQSRDYSLTTEEFLGIVKSNCHYCGLPPSNYLTKTKVTDPITKKRLRTPEKTRCYYSGIDRVDNLKGYVLDNVVPCCKMCNKAKHYHTTEEFKAWIQRAYSWMFNDYSRQGSRPMQVEKETTQLGNDIV